MNRYPRIILTTGGTGGHIFPALAVAEQIRALDPEAELLFIGSVHGPEGALAAQAGLPFIGLPVHGVLGRGLRAVGALRDMLGAIRRARKLLADFMPDAVAGFGAYASMPALVAAKLGGVPIAIHEQNARPGLSNRLMGRLAGQIFLSLPDRFGAFDPQKCVLTGNPVRGAIAGLYHTPPSVHEARLPRLLVMGGSQGARAINSAVLGALPRFTGVYIQHQTGEADFERVRAGYAAHGFGPDRAEVAPFIHDMADAYAHADVVLCRSGATTVAELALAGCPAVFIPFPHATHDHQTANAQVMADAGAALLVPEKSLADQDLAGQLLALLRDTPRREVMSLAARGRARPDAAANVARGILQLVMKK